MAHERFFNPIDLDKDIAVGIKLPLNSKTGGLFDLSYTTEEQGLSNLKNLLLTRKGERYMQPLFGSSIYDALFELNTPDLIASLQSGITNDINFWLPYIVIDELNIEPRLPGETEAYGQGIQIELKFRVTEQGANQTITLNVGDQGQITAT